jgi:pantetheine-phosphate adenylyltransferase
MKIAVYPGSFDPITNGHIAVVERAAKIFDRIYVAVIRNPEKKTSFDLSARKAMIKEGIAHIKIARVDSFDGLLVDYAKKVKACAIIRGLRAVSDFDFEFQMALANRRICREIETIFIMTDYKYSYLSSSLVKQMAAFGGDITGLVPKIVEGKLNVSRRKNDGDSRFA